VVAALACAHADIQRYIQDAHGRRVWNNVPSDVLTGAVLKMTPPTAHPAPDQLVQHPEAVGSQIPDTLPADFARLVAAYVHKARVMFPPQYMPKKQIELTPYEFFEAARPLRDYRVTRGASGTWIVTPRPAQPHSRRPGF
jgi:hypothetical protein